MTRWIVGSSLRLAAAVLAAALLIIGLGLVQLRHGSVDSLPEFGLPQVQVQTTALGLSSAEVEQLITIPLEDEFNGLPFLNTLRSQSVPGLSAIQLTFNPGTDIYRARQLVTERVAQGPSVVNVGTPPVMIQPLSSTARVMMIGLSSKTVSPINMSTLARWRIRPRLLAVPGVANVTIWGQRDQQLQVLVDPAKLEQNGVTLDQVINTTGDAMWTSPLTFVQASAPGADGFIDTPNQRISVQHILPISKPQDLAQVPVEDVKGRTMTLGQVTTVVEDHPALAGDALLSSGPGFLMVVEKFPNANTLAVTKGIQSALDDLKSGLTGITVDSSVYQPANYITNALHNVGIAALIALVLVVAWLGFVWRSWRVALIALVALLLSYVAATYVLYLNGTTFNALILAGLVVAVGVIVDDIVVGVTAMKRRFADRDDTGATKGEAIRDAVVTARRPLWFALAILIVTALPLLLLTGFDGSFARPMITSYLLALVVSTVVAVVVTPVLGFLLLSAAAHDRRSNPVANWLETRVERAAPTVGKRRIWVWAAVAVLGLMALAVVPQLGSGSLIPNLHDRDLVVRWTALNATSMPEMERVTTTAAADMRAIPGVRDVATNVGQALFGDQIVDVNSAETWVTIKPSADYGATMAKIQTIVDNYPGIRHTVSTYQAASIQDAHVDSGQPLTVRLYGTDQKTLATEAAQIRQEITKVKGVTNPVVHTPATEPSIQIAVNVAAAAKYGLKPGDIRRDSAVLVSGIPVGSYYEDQQIFDVAVWSDPAQRQNLTTVQNLMLDTPDGKQVPLKSVAAVTIAPALPVIEHDQVSRYMDITAGVDGAVGPVMNAVQQKLESIPLPLGYHAETFSDLAVRHAADQRTLWYVLAAVIALYLLLQAVFHSWMRAVVLLITLPLAVAGGALTGLFAGRSITSGALLGFITVFGLALRQGILLIRRIQGIEAEGTAGAPITTDDDYLEPGAIGTPTWAAVVEATRRSVFPLVATVVAVALAVIPFMIRGTVPGTEFLRPMALVIIGGLITTLIVTLVVLPALYTILIVDRADRARARVDDPPPVPPTVPATA